MLSNRVALDSYAFANPLNNSVTVTQSNGGIALDPHDSRLTQVSYMDGMLWTGVLLSAVIRKGLSRLPIRLSATTFWVILQSCIDLQDCALRIATGPYTDGK